MRRVLVAHGSAGAALLIAAAPVQAAERPLPRADLRVDLTGPMRRVKVGDVVRYTVRVHNAGPAATGRAVTEVRLPGGVAVVEISDPGCREHRRALRCRTDALPVGAARVVHILGIVKPAARGSYHARAQVAAARTSDPNEGDNASGVITRVAPSTDVAVMLDAPRRAFRGGRLTLAVTVVNRGPRTARGVTVHLGAHGARMAPPRGCRATGAQAGSHFLRCSFGGLPVGTGRTLYVPARGSAAARLLVQEYAATASVAIGDRRPANNNVGTRVRVARRGGPQDTR